MQGILRLAGDWARRVRMPQLVPTVTFGCHGWYHWYVLPTWPLCCAADCRAQQKLSSLHAGRQAQLFIPPVQVGHKPLSTMLGLISYFVQEFC